MSAMPPMNGMYNIQAEEPDGYIHYQTVPNLPPFSDFDDECGGLADQLRKVISAHLGDKGFPAYNSIHGEIFGEDSIGEFPSDRTMYFYVDELDAFTPDFVRLLQDQVLTSYPLWRLMAQYEGKEIGIYPQGVWLKDQWVQGYLDENYPAYRDWLEDARAYREEQFGPLARQLAYVRRLIPSAIADAQAAGFTVLASFDRSQPRCPGHSIWILHSSRLGELALDNAEDGFARLCLMVGQDGTVYPRFWRDLSVFIDGVAPLQLAKYVVKPAATHEYVLKNSQGDSVGSISVKAVIEDSNMALEGDPKVHLTL